MTDQLKSYYRSNFLKYGVHEKSLGWTKEKQFIRFHELTRFFRLESREILDIGCGFGDLVTYLELNDLNFSRYYGIDLMEEFLDVARQKHIGKNINFTVGDYLRMDIPQIDFVVASGIFGHKLHDNEEENYRYIESVFAKALVDARIGVAFDFVSDKVEYRTSDSDFHASPSKILDLGYKFSKNVILNNSAMPFEFSLTIFKDDSFAKERTVFNHYFEDFPHFKNGSKL